MRVSVPGVAVTATPGCPDTVYCVARVLSSRLEEFTENRGVWDILGKERFAEVEAALAAMVPATTPTAAATAAAAAQVANGTFEEPIDNDDLLSRGIHGLCRSGHASLWDDVASLRKVPLGLRGLQQVSTTKKKGREKI